MAIDNQPIMSKTQHYRKVTKPLLERKRRARMNHYLDELKELIIETMESNGEHVTKLEKADILELTVEYLKSKREHQQQQQQNQSESKLLESSSDEQSLTTKSSNRITDVINVEKFRAGYTQAAYEVSKVFASVPGINVKFGSRLMKHLAYQLKDLYPVQSSILSSSSSSSSSSVSDVDYDDDDDNKDRKIIDKKSSEFIGLHQLDNNKISLNYYHYQNHQHQHQHQHHHHHHHHHQNQNHNQNHNEHFQYNHNDRHHPYLLYDRNQQNHYQQLSALAAEQHNHLNDDNDDNNIIIHNDEHKNLLPSVNDVWRPW